jgi:hypothetical protein
LPNEDQSKKERQKFIEETISFLNQSQNNAAQQSENNLT